MTTKVITTLVCDLPHEDGKEAEGRTVLVATAEGSWEVELCPQHGEKFLTVLIRAGRRTRTRVRPGA